MMEEKLLKIIQNCYFQNLPLIYWIEDLRRLLEVQKNLENGSNVQQTILKYTLSHPLSLKYPPSLQFRISFSKKLIMLIEELNFEIDEELYEILGSLLNVTCKQDECAYKTYFIGPNSKSISIKENVNFISEGTTGLVTWPAAKFLFEWCVENFYEINCKRILELGSGIGFTGLAITKILKPTAYTFTDQNLSVLKMLCQNINISMLEFSPQAEAFYGDDDGIFLKKQSDGIDFAVCILDWNFKLDEMLLNHDILLAADVVYDPELLDPLVNTIHQFLEYDSDRCAYIACTIRNKDTIELFLKKIHMKSLKAAPIAEGHSAKFPHHQNDQNHALCVIYKIICDKLST